VKEEKKDLKLKLNLKKNQALVQANKTLMKLKKLKMKKHHWKRIWDANAYSETISSLQRKNSQ
jgi:hypothetical protein